MDYLEENRQKMTEIIFARRNKNYGAYVLRSSYGNTVMRSLLYMSAGLVTVIVITYIATRVDVPIPDTGGQTIITIVDLPPVSPPVDKKKAAVPPPSDPGRKSGGAESTRVVDSAAVTARTAEPTGSSSSSATAEATGTTGATQSVTTFSIEKKENKEPVLVADEMPEFEGGLNALRKWIATNIRYPEEAIEYRQEGVVYVRFIVDESGKISEPTLMNHIGFGMDNEALRVVGLLPSFSKPAKVGGEPVKCYFQVPIRYRLAR